MQNSASINLLKGRINLLDEIIKWASNVGRLLIIIVEFIAFSAFILRFSLDRTLIDLSDKIKQEQAIVASLKDREASYRNLQERLLVTNKITTQSSGQVKLIQDIFGLTPPEIKYNNFGISGNKITMQLRVRSVSALTAYIDSLRAYKGISSASIDSIGSKTSDGSLTVGVSAILQKGSGI
jgi:Tfp pilus assembly protein PilN